MQRHHGGAQHDSTFDVKGSLRWSIHSLGSQQIVLNHCMDHALGGLQIPVQFFSNIFCATDAWDRHVFFLFA